MTEHIEISSDVFNLVVEHITVFYDPNKLSEEDYIVLQDEIVLAGLQEVTSRRSMEREV